MRYHPGGLYDASFCSIKCLFFSTLTPSEVIWPRLCPDLSFICNMLHVNELLWYFLDIIPNWFDYKMQKITKIRQLCLAYQNVFNILLSNRCHVYIHTPTPHHRYFCLFKLLVQFFISLNTHCFRETWEFINCLLIHFNAKNFAVPLEFRTGLTWV